MQGRGKSTRSLVVRFGGGALLLGALLLVRDSGHAVAQDGEPEESPPPR
jgi:hypothetical protein